MNGTLKNWLSQLKPVDWNRREPRQSSTLQPPKLNASGLLWISLGALLLSCSGCATPSPVVTTAPNPAPPPMTEPLPQNSYLSEVQLFLNELRKAVTDM